MSPDMEKFFSRIKDYSSKEMCWFWDIVNKEGYGHFVWQGKKYKAHRWIYAQLNEIPTGYVVDHLCRNKACVNPEHLEAVTFEENARRANLGRERGHTTVCNKGHIRTEENTYVYPNNLIACRICRQENRRRYYNEKGN